jgi:hypothetical protein
MNAQRNGTGVDLNKYNPVTMSSLVVSDTIHKSVLGEKIDGISRHQCNESCPMDERPSSMHFFPLHRGPNGLMVIFLVINVSLTI